MSERLGIDSVVFVADGSQLVDDLSDLWRKIEQACRHRLGRARRKCRSP